MRRVLTLAAVAAICGAEAYSQINDPITNDELPNPYRTLRDWAELPKGMTWPAITGALEGSDGRLYVLGRCHENSCAGRSEPPVLIYDQFFFSSRRRHTSSPQPESRWPSPARRHRRQ